MTYTIGILNADEVRPELEATYGDYPAMFTELLKSADSDINIVTYNVMKGEYPASIDEVDGYLLTGSKFSVYQNEEWIKKLGEFIFGLNARRKKLVAICFGHQIIAHFLGGQTQKSDKGWGVGVQTCTLYEDIAGFANAGESVSFLATHQDQVMQTATGAKVLAGNDFCPNMMTSINDHVLTIQWHPEFAKGYAESLLHIRREVIGEETFQVAMDSLEQDIDNDKFARLAMDFFRR
ncbi:MAG: GMP synthase-like glutamine amidotransferase [Chitinophagales bacterium]|jgi:GMP synthase-like glutamine amidotransferase